MFSRILLALAISVAGFAHAELILEKEKLFRGVDDVKLAAFNVSFTTMEAKSASTISIDNFHGAKSALTVDTVGITEELAQRITNAAYEDFVAKVEAKGMTVSAFDAASMADDYMTKAYFSKMPEGPIREDCSHYQGLSSVIKTMTVSAMDLPFYCFPQQWLVGYVGKQQKESPIVVNMLVNSGYLETRAAKVDDDFFGKVYNRTSVRFHPGVQVFWRSGLDVWPRKNRNGEIKIKDHIYMTGPAGKLEVTNDEEWGRRSYARMRLTIDPDMYYAHATQVLFEANTRLINALDKAR